MSYKIIGREWKCDYCGDTYSQHWLYDKDLNKICCEKKDCRRKFKREINK